LSVVYGLRLSDLNKETTLLYFNCDRFFNDRLSTRRHSAVVRFWHW